MSDKFKVNQVVLVMAHSEKEFQIYTEYRGEGYTYCHRTDDDTWKPSQLSDEKWLVCEGIRFAGNVTALKGNNIVLHIDDGDTIVTDGYNGSNANSVIVSAIKNYKRDKERSSARETELQVKSDSFKPRVDIIGESSITIDVGECDTVHDKYIKITGSMNDTIDQLNDSNSLGDQKELADAFIKAKEQIKLYTSTDTGSAKGFLGKYIGDKKWFKKVTAGVKKAKSESSSVKKNIDQLFGLIHEKYEKLILTAEGLQASKATILAQLEALGYLDKESDEVLAEYEEATDVPVRELSLNTQIKASIEKYRNKLSGITAAIQAMQGTIIALGRDLPAHKSDLEDEMAIGGLLNNVDDYQQMVSEIRTLVTSVTNATRTQTYTVISNLLDLQISDTHTMEAIAENAEKGQALVTMVSEKSQVLADKAQHDAIFISAVSSGKTIKEAKRLAM